MRKPQQAYMASKFFPLGGSVAIPTCISTYCISLLQMSEGKWAPHPLIVPTFSTGARAGK